MFQEIRGARIQQAAMEVAIDSILAEITKIGITQRRRYPCRESAFFLDMQGYVGEQLRVGSGLQRCTAIPAALMAAVISGIGGVSVILS